MKVKTAIMLFFCIELLLRGEILPYGNLFKSELWDLFAACFQAQITFAYEGSDLGTNDNVWSLFFHLIKRLSTNFALGTVLQNGLQ